MSYIKIALFVFFIKFIHCLIFFHTDVNLTQTEL